MPNMPKSCHKHAKVHAKVCSVKNDSQFKQKQIEGTQKETYFPSGEAEFAAIRPFRSERLNGWVKLN